MKKQLQLLGALLCLAGYLHAQVTISGSVSVTGQVVISNNAPTPACTITTASEPNGQTGVAYTGNVLTTSGCTGSVTFSATGLPPGLNITTTNGQIIGTPTTVGMFSTQVSGTDQSTPPQVAKITYSIVITQGAPPPPACQITTATEPSGQQNSAYTGNVLNTANCTGPLTFSVSAGNLPGGTTMTVSNGQVMGTPTAPGTFNFTAKVVDSSGPAQTAFQNLSIVINPAPACVITTNSEPNGVVSSPYAGATIQTANCVAPVTYSTPSSVPGLSMSTATGVWSGTPTAAGNYSVTINGKDSSNPVQTPSVTLNINISASGPPGGGHNEDCNSSGVWIGPASDGDGVVTAAAPTGCIYTARSATPSPGSTVTVCASGCTYTSLAAAEAAISCGQIVQIKSVTAGVQNTYGPARTTFSHNCDAAHWITYETDQLASLPPEGTRITPGWLGVSSLAIPCTFAISGNCGRPAYTLPTTVAVYLPKILGTASGVFSFAATANHYRFIGLQLTTPSGTTVTQMVSGANGAQNLIFDQVFLNGGNSPTFQDRDTIQAGFAMNGITGWAVVDSTILDTHCLSGTCTDSQGIAMGGNATVASGAPCKNVDNFIESSGEDVFAGGSGAGASTLPVTDCEVRLNHLFKPLFWYNKTGNDGYFGTAFEIKNALELKNAQRIWIDGDIFEDSWEGSSDQFGDLVLLTPKNQSAPYTGAANDDGAGNLTWVSGNQFRSTIVSPNCAVANRCRVITGGFTCTATTFNSATSILIGNCVDKNGNSGLPPAGSAVAFTAYDPGLNPSAIVTDIVVRNSLGTGASRFAAIAASLSDGGDASLGVRNVVFENDAADDISGDYFAANAGGCCFWGDLYQATNSNANPNNAHNIAIFHTTGIAFLSGSNPCTNPHNCSPAFGFGSTISTGAITNLRMYDNVGNAGWIGNSHQPNAIAALQGLDSLNGVAQNTYCFSHNLLENTYEDNPPYPQDSGQASSPGCGFTTAVNNRVSSWGAVGFTAFNGGIGGNYQLLSTSPGHLAAHDGTDIGVNWTNLQNAIATVGPTLGGSPSTAPNWQLITPPAGATLLDNFDIKQSNNHWFLADRNNGIYISTNQGASWTAINTGLPTNNCTSLGGSSTGICGWTIQVNPHTGDLIANLAGPSAGTSHFYRSTNEGTSWTQIPEPGGFSISRGAFLGGLMPPAGGGTMLLSGAGCSGCTIMYSTNDGTATTLSTESPSMGNAESTGINGNTYGAGGENGGFQTSPSGAAFAVVWNCGVVGPTCGNSLDSTEIYSQITDGAGNWVISTRTGVWKSGGPASAPTSWTQLYKASARDRVVFRDSLGNYYFGQTQTATNFTVVRSSNGGVTWQEWDTGIGTGLEAHKFVEDLTDSKICAVIENGQTNTGSLYCTAR